MNTSRDQAQQRPQRHLVPVIASVVGGIVLLGVGGTAALATVGATSTGRGADATHTADMQGVTSVDIDSNASQFTFAFGDVSEATLTVEGGDADRWSMTIDENELEVVGKRKFFDFCLMWCGSRDEQVTLTLPKSLDDGSLDIDFEVNAGTLVANGAFRELSLEVNAGSLTFAGDASTLEASVNAGRADAEVQGARSADLDVSAGRMTLALAGAQPDEVSLDVSAGKLKLTVPRGTYDVRSDVSAGSLDNRLDTSSRSTHLIDAAVSAGSAELRPGE